MGRRVPTAAAQPASQMDGDTRNVPPSTISALVQHQSRAKTAGPQSGDDQLAIFELLHDIRANPKEHLTDDLEVHGTLVHALVQEFLGLASRSDPFEAKEKALEHATSCLDVIGMTLTRTPRVLFHKDNLNAEAGLCLWMLPKLFSAIIEWQDETLQSRIQHTLRLCLQVLDGSYRYRNLASKLQQFYRICVDDLVASLQNPSSSATHPAALSMTLPSAEAREAVVGHQNLPVVVKNDSQFTFKSIEHATATSLHLQLALIESKARQSGRIGASNLSDAWHIEVLHQLWGIISPKLTAMRFGQPSSLLVMYSKNVTKMLERLTHSKQDCGNEARLFPLVENCLGLLLPLSGETMTQSLQLSLTKMINGAMLILSGQKQACSAVRTRLSEAMSLCISNKPLPQLAAAISNASNTMHLELNITDPTVSSGLISNGITNGVAEHGSMQQANGMSNESPRPMKRQRLDDGHRAGARGKASSPNDLLERLCSLLGNWSRNDLSGLQQAAPGLFSDLSEPQQLELLKILALLPSTSAKIWKATDWTNFHGILCSLLETKEIHHSKKFRVKIAIAIKAFTTHTPQSEQLDLTSSAMGKWCLQSLRSSVRQLRIIAALTIPSFIADRGRGEVTFRNRVVLLDVLRQLADLDDARYSEALVLAFGQVACICEDDERAIALNQLIEYLGHTSKLVCDMAFLELKQVSSSIGCSTPNELLNPFWRVNGVTIVKDLLTRPQKVQQIADLVGLRVDQFLSHVQTDVMPWLVLEKKQDILVRIARVRGSDTSVWDLCVHRRNLPAILAAIIVQHPEEIETAIASCLKPSNPDFQVDDSVNLLKTETIAVACEVLKVAGDKNGVDREKAVHGFREFTILVERRGPQTKAASTQARMSTLFFENHALGIMNSLSAVIDNDQDSAASKRRCLIAIEQLIIAGRTDVIVALPQIRACLQSAMKTQLLRDSAFIAWSSLIPAVKSEEELQGLLEQTFATIVQNWDTFSQRVQQLAYDAVASLIKDHGELVQGMIASVPSLGSVPLLSKFQGQLSRFRDRQDVGDRLQAFSRRCRDENATVVLQALREMAVYLEQNQDWIHKLAVTEQPSSIISNVMRSLLDTCVRFNEDSEEVLELAAKCLGIVGCLDPNRVETIREKTELVLSSNFYEQDESVEFVVYLLEVVLVKAFHSVSNPRAQGFLAYVMQELLRFCGFDKEAASPFRPNGSQNDLVYQRWLHMDDKTRSTLTPFLSSHYVLTTQQSKSSDRQTYPIFSRAMSHGTWLRTFVMDLLQRPKGDNAKQIFSVLSRVIRGYDATIAAFILPFAAANIMLGGTDSEAEDIGNELLTVLQCETSTSSQAHIDTVKAASENVFQILDYLGVFVQTKKKALNSARSMAARTARPMSDLEEQTFLSQINCVERIQSKIPAHTISRRAVECGSYARALYHWEQHMRYMQEEGSRPQARPVDSEKLYQQLQDIYGQIDEPDGVDGISTYLHALKPEQQVLEHRRAGRWAAAQSWYELKLREEPENLGLHVSLLQCLKHSGQHQLVLDYAGGLDPAHRQNSQVLSITSEAAWTTRKLESLDSALSIESMRQSSDFNVGLATAMVALRDEEETSFSDTIKNMRVSVAKTMSRSATSSLQACHDQLLKLHTLHDVESISGANGMEPSRDMTPRFNILGSYNTDKQYLLSVARATMLLSSLDFSDGEMASTWIMSGKLARKEKRSNIAYEAVLNAGELGDETSKVEQAKLLWNDGEHNKAIKSLETAIDMNAFSGAAGAGNSTSASFSTAANATAATGKDSKQPEQNLLVAKAHLLLAKWLDDAGQTQSGAINLRYQQAARSFTRWEKGLYHLGRFYNKLLESEKALPPSRQNHTFLSGETAKLVIENFLRSVMFGGKYLFESVPKLLTLWLDFGIDIRNSLSKEIPDDVRTKAADNRPKMLKAMNTQIQKYSEKLPAYLFYTALPQMITRMGHPNKAVYDQLAAIIIKVVSAHPQQGLWPLLAVVKSSEKDRAGRANGILSKLMDKGKNIRNEGQNVDLRSLVNHGQKMSAQLLNACEVTLSGRSSTISLAKDMGFSGKVAPCPLVVPVDQHLSASLPTTTKSHSLVKAHRAFPASREAVTISSFQDDVLVLNSLQRPRKLTIRGSDGRKYGLLAKPNDDLRKDQRLMEFNAMINRGLKKDAESSKRRLYIRTYAVTPLNEACGLIEWVDGLKPLRDILLNSYRAKGTKVDYNLLRELLNEACQRPENSGIFSEQIVPMYEPVLQEWFTEHFSDPESWFGARLRYARSCAVASMQGYALGLGDRHGENVLLEESSGGVFHVDFNCLFEKGLTFDKPELVPFRLTHNMVDAMGAYGVEGPFRRSAECAMSVMRTNEDALLTILETFVYDPTADFVGARKRPVKGVPETPKEVLESVRSKLRGLMRGESVYLSVGGHVDALIKQATDPKNLCAMYIGWCAFL